MLKRIPQSDISIRPFKAYKTWKFDQDSTDISVFYAQEGNYTNETTSSAGGLTFYNNALYGQIRAQFYNGKEDNVFIRSGYKTNVYNADDPNKTERFLSGSATIISIPQRFVGDGIRPESVRLFIDSELYVDDGFSNIGYNYVELLDVEILDFQTGVFNFWEYYTGDYYQCSVDNTTWDMNSGQIEIIYPAFSTNPNDRYAATMYSWDVNATPSLMYASDLPFVSGSQQGLQMGNVFYNQGLLVLTRDFDSLRTSNNWSLEYQSTETIYEHEYLCVVNETEFNVSTNPTAVVAAGYETEWFDTTYEGKVKVTTKPGVKYVRKRQVLNQDGLMDYSYISSVNSAVSGGFEHWEANELSDPTGSYLMPMITTIGLYDDNMDLVAVAKLPRPIKSMHNMPVNFLVRFDM